MKNHPTILPRECLRRISGLVGLLSLVVITATAAGWFASSSVSIKQVTALTNHDNTEIIPVVINQSSQVIKEMPTLNGTIYIEPAELDLGQVERGTIVKATVRLVNETPYPITISEVITSCGCTVVDIPKDSIQSGGSVELPLQLEMPHRANRRLRSTITLLFEGEHEPVELQVIGESVEGVVKQNQ